MNNDLEGQIMREFPLLQKKIILYFFFCTTRWVKNANVTKKVQKNWPKLVAIVKYWSTLPQCKQPGRADPK